jgi:hypothetical protein
MKKIENPAKLSKGCKKKGLTNVSSSQNIQCYHVFFKRTYQRTKQIVVFRRWGAGVGKGRLSQPMAYKRKSDGVVNGGLSRVA